jgi:hypothetical protein
MSSRVPTINRPNDWSKGIKKEGGSYSPSLSTRGFVESLYVEVPDLFSSNGICSFARKDFVEKYDLCYKGMNPKYIKIPKYCTKEEIEKLFGLVVNKNKHCYT